jgi:predicted nucleotidyltransferase
MNISLQSYLRSRNVLITSLVTELSSDERILAAWLTGSYARNEADAVSDLDLTVVIAQPHHTVLCARQDQISHTTTKERLELFSRFGEPALIHENNNNAPEGGTFTFILYSGSSLMVDWTLRPHKNAERPFQSLILFDKANIPVSSAPEPDELEKSKRSVAETWAFFWMMTAITIKYVIRQDDVFVTRWLEILHGLIEEIERQLHREPQQYRRGSLSILQHTRKEQIETVRSLCSKMKSLAPQIEQFSGIMLALPVEEIETLLSLAEEDHASH